MYGQDPAEGFVLCACLYMCAVYLSAMCDSCVQALLMLAVTHHDALKAIVPEILTI